MDTKFAVAIHSLIMLAKTKEVLTSEIIATSVGTNASYIRKVLALLKNANIIRRKNGKTGYELVIKPANLSLYNIYMALYQVEPSLFDIHQNPSDACLVGRHIKSTLGVIFSNLEVEFVNLLKNKTLADCIIEMEYELTEEEQKSLWA